jgi:hypothetical protein
MLRYKTAGNIITIDALAGLRTAANEEVLFTVVGRTSVRSRLLALSEGGLDDMKGVPSRSPPRAGQCGQINAT